MTLIRSRATKLLPFLLLCLAGVAHAQTPPTEPPPPAEVTEPIAPAPPAPPANPDKLKVAKEGYFTPAILFQGWYTVDANGGTDTDAFLLRRAEFHAKGQVVPNKVAYEINVDFAKVLETKTVSVPTVPDPTPVAQPLGKLSALQDVYITYLSKYAEVSIGQFKIPVSYEGYNSSGKLLFPERAAVSKTFGDKRDIGLRVTKTFTKFMYSAGVFNGTGLNVPESNPGKDVGLRLEYYPIKGLTIAGVTYDSVFDRKQPGAKDRWELDVRYEKDALLLQAEALKAVDYDATKTKIGAHGMYVAAAYRLKNNIQPMVRFGALDPNEDAMDDSLLHVDVGANYYLQDHNAKLQLAYTRTQFQDDTKSADNLVILAAQVYY
jgi:hypothetical protein